MKKRFLNCLLIAVTCALLASCGNSNTGGSGLGGRKEITPDYVGTWIATNEDMPEIGGTIRAYHLQLNEDGTAVYKDAEGEKQLEWYYNAKSECLCIVDGKNVRESEIEQTDNGLETKISINGNSETYIKTENGFGEAISSNGYRIFTEEEFKQAVSIIDITSDNWRDYFQVYSYESISKDAYDKITDKELHAYLGYKEGLYLFSPQYRLTVSYPDDERRPVNSYGQTDFSFSCGVFMPEETKYYIVDEEGKKIENGYGHYECAAYDIMELELKSTYGVLLLVDIDKEHWFGSYAPEDLFKQCLYIGTPYEYRVFGYDAVGHLLYSTLFDEFY